MGRTGNGAEVFCGSGDGWRAAVASAAWEPGQGTRMVSVTVTLSRAALTLAPSALHFEEPPQSSRTLATCPDQVWRRPQKCTRSHLYSHLSSGFINGPCTTYL